MLRFDLALFSLIHNRWGANRFLDAVGIFLANILTYLMVLGMLAFLFFAVYSNQERLFVAAEMLLAYLISRFLITGTIAVLVARPRPFVTLRFEPPFIPLTVGGFPSGHASTLFAIAFVMLAYSMPWGVAYLLLSFMVGLARVFVGVHWPSDVLAGLAIGLGAGFLVHSMFISWYDKAAPSGTPVTENSFVDKVQ